MTPYMQADEIINAFNAAADRTYWRAVMSGSRMLPTVTFNSRSSMVSLVYHISSKTYTVSFSKVACAWGDYTGSTHRAMFQILTSLKAAGLDVAAPLTETDFTTRLEYDPITKLTTAHVAKLGDDWTDATPLVFKVSENNVFEGLTGPTDTLSS